MEILICISFSAPCEVDGIQIAVRFIRLQSPTVVSFVHHLKFCFFADNTASVWPKLFILILEREKTQHFSPKAVADLGQFYRPGVLQPASFVLCLTKEVFWELSCYQIFCFNHSFLVPSLIPSAAYI